MLVAKKRVIVLLGKRKGEDKELLRIVQCAFKPLCRVGVKRVLAQVGEMATERAHTLTPHGVTFICHGGRADLVLLERLLHLFRGGKMSNIPTDLLASRAEARHRTDDIRVHLSRVRLRRDGVCIPEPSKLGHKTVELLNFLVVASEDSQERSLGSRGSLGTAETKVVPGAGEVAEIPEEVLEPEAGTLANGGKLGGLVVSVAKGSEVFVLNGEFAEFVDYIGEFGEDYIEALFEEDQVCIVGAVTASSYVDGKWVSVNWCLFHLLLGRERGGGRGSGELKHRVTYLPSE